MNENALSPVSQWEKELEGKNVEKEKEEEIQITFA